MVCEKCEKKLGRVITPDTWKDGARNTTESGGRKLNENKALTSKKARFDPYGKNKFSTCRICKSSVHQPGSHYCQGCAYKKASVQCVAKRSWIPKLQTDFRLDVLLNSLAFYGCTFCFDFSSCNTDVPSCRITWFKMNDSI